MYDEPHESLAYEQLLLSRHASLGTPPYRREFVLERSATVLLARLEATGPMTVAELSEAFGLDVSTIHRQVTAAMKSGLIERIKDPEGGTARKHRPTELGLARLHTELSLRSGYVKELTTDWTPEELDTFVSLLARFNDASEARRGHRWPRP